MLYTQLTLAILFHSLCIRFHLNRVVCTFDFSFFSFIHIHTHSHNATQHLHDTIYIEKSQRNSACATLAIWCNFYVLPHRIRCFFPLPFSLSLACSLVHSFFSILMACKFDFATCHAFHGVWNTFISCVLSISRRFSSSGSQPANHGMFIRFLIMISSFNRIDAIERAHHTSFLITGILFNYLRFNRC